MQKFRDLPMPKHIFILFSFTIALFYVIAFSLSSPEELLKGMINIVSCRDVLITDYFIVGGMGAAFFNSALVMTISLLIILVLKMNFTGLTIASLMIMGGFSFFGKQPFNVLPIIFGTILYAKTHKLKAERYIHIGFLASGVAPIVTEMKHLLPFNMAVNVIIAILVGLMIGYMIVPLSAHTVGMHMGYNIFNVGFAVGILALCIMTVMSMLGFKSETVLIWQEGAPTWLIGVIFGYFIIMLLYGLVLGNFKIRPLLELMEHSGRSVADFILMDGLPPTLMNMSLVGMASLIYILLIGGDLSGPVVGAILTVSGFGAFGIHLRNFPPVLVGVFIASVLGIYTPTTPSFQLAAIFSGALSPITGQFGIFAGIFAGFLHSAIVSNTGALYSGMNLYNNGFSAGFVAIVMLPLIESFMKHYKSSSR